MAAPTIGGSLEIGFTAYGSIGLEEGVGGGRCGTPEKGRSTWIVGSPSERERGEEELFPERGEKRGERGSGSWEEEEDPPEERWFRRPCNSTSARLGDLPN